LVKIARLYDVGHAQHDVAERGRLEALAARLGSLSQIPETYRLRGLAFLRGHDRARLGRTGEDARFRNEMDHVAARVVQGPAPLGISAERHVAPPELGCELVLVRHEAVDRVPDVADVRPLAGLSRDEVERLRLLRVAEFDGTPPAVVPCDLHAEHFHVEIAGPCVIGYGIGE